MNDCCAILLHLYKSGCYPVNDDLKAFAYSSNLAVIVVTSLKDRSFTPDSHITTIDQEGEQCIAKLVHKCVCSTKKKYSVAAVHCLAQPFVKLESVARVINAAKTGRKNGACIGINAVDTVKAVTNGIVTRTIDRNFVWSLNMPIAVNFNDLKSVSHKLTKQNVNCFNSADFITQLYNNGIDFNIIEE